MGGREARVIQEIKEGDISISSMDSVFNMDTLLLIIKNCDAK